ncbi:MAG: exodeoxyribonuclease VII large subunit [Actinobacteria bacterium]|nr:exodeoxyribonuclease VII large subunit [Actinomycetota bacterium]
MEEEFTLPFLEEETVEEPGAAGEDVLTVTEVNRIAKQALEQIKVTVQGEISGLNSKYSYYIYFDLRDENAAIPAIINKRYFGDLDFTMEDGALVVVKGTLSLYERQGKYQIRVEEMRPFGEGDLQRKIEALKRKLHKEGLFDDSRKKGLPRFPASIGVVTSRRGAAVRDVTVTLKRRFPPAGIYVRGVQVQGEAAAGQICEALRFFDRDYKVDLVILARGGGSLQDLEPFNTEEVARAIASMKTPLITGVGHEPDITISDLVADHRASTPTGAAEAAVPDKAEVLSLLGKQSTILQRRVSSELAVVERRLTGLRGRPVFHDRSYLLGPFMQRFERAASALPGSPRRGFLLAVNRLQLIINSPIYRKPDEMIKGFSVSMAGAQDGFRRASATYFERHRTVLDKTGSRLTALSPLAVLDRGYSITFNKKTGEVIRASEDVPEGTPLRIKLARGGLLADVSGKE